MYHVTGQGNVEIGSAAVMVPKLFGVKKPLVALGDSTDDGSGSSNNNAGVPAASRSMA
ncbi:hypothetical protein D3C84_1319150 [compost metagenome]